MIKKSMSFSQWAHKLKTLEELLSPPDHLKDTIRRSEDRGWLEVGAGLEETSVDRYTWKKLWFDGVGPEDWKKIEAVYPQLVRRMKEQMFKGSYDWATPAYMAIKYSPHLFLELFQEGVQQNPKHWLRALSSPDLFLTLIRNKQMDALAWLKNNDFGQLTKEENEMLGRLGEGGVWNIKVITQLLIKDDVELWGIFKDRIPLDVPFHYKDRALNVVQLSCFFHAKTILDQLWQDPRLEKKAWSVMEDEFGQGLVVLAVKGIKTVIFMKERQGWVSLSEEQFKHVCNRFSNVYLWLKERELLQMLPTGWAKPAKILATAGIKKEREFRDLKMKDKTLEEFMMRVVHGPCYQALLKESLLDTHFKQVVPLLDDEGDLLPSPSRRL